MLGNFPLLFAQIELARAVMLASRSDVEHRALTILTKGAQMPGAPRRRPVCKLRAGSVVSAKPAYDELKEARLTGKPRPGDGRLRGPEATASAGPVSRSPESATIDHPAEALPETGAGR